MVPIVLHREGVLRDARAFAAYERALLAQARSEGRGRMCVWSTTGDVVALGRYHAVPPRAARACPELCRRLAGGRVVPAGDGFVGIAIALPHRSALAGAGPALLAPEQVLNRAVRGVLGALEALAVGAFYPGRDVITVNGRIVGAMAFDVDATGAALIEITLAVARSFAELPHVLDRVDPDGAVPIDMLLPEQATTIAAELHREPAFDELVDRLRLGYERRLGVAMTDASDGPRVGAPDVAWIEAGIVPARLDRRARRRTMLGMLEAHVALANDRTIADVRLAGDVIASSATIARIEDALRGRSAAPGELSDVVARAASGPDDFVLGVGPLATIADVVTEACEAGA